MYRSYDDMFTFSDPEEGAEFVNEKLAEINKIVDAVFHVESVDEITDLVNFLRDAATQIDNIYDDQLEEADKIMRSGPNPDEEWDTRE